eukprot:6371825-Alexandrium_andersonii.AAC.1
MPTDSSVILATPQGEPVGEGRKIPLSQILAGPRRAGPLLFDEEVTSDRRSLQQMIDAWNPYSGPETGRGKLGKLANRAF